MRSRHIVVIAAFVVAGTAGSAWAEVIRTPGNEVAIGTTAADDPDGRYVAVANGGDAYAYDSNSAAVSTAGTAGGGLVSVSGADCAYRGWVVNVGGGCAVGGFILTASPFGNAGPSDEVSTPPVVVASGTGCAEGWIVAVSATNCASGFVAVSGTGNAASTGPLANGLASDLAVSGTGDANGKGVVVAGDDATTEGGAVAIALTGDAHGAWVANIAPLGNAGE